MTLAVGVDAWRKGWVAVALVDGRFHEARPAARFEEVLEAYPDAAVIAVDIPIGAPETGVRAADRLARGFLGPRASSVFSTPPRSALEAATYAEARALGLGVSSQAYALRRRILEVDEAARADRRVVEAHPEVSFRALAGKTLPPKKTWAGQAERRTALAAAGIELPEDLGPANVVPPDDLLDAAVAAWSAQRVAEGRAERLGDDGAAIWY
jgi:predicted RNase H-like nuclease